MNKLIVHQLETAVLRRRNRVLITPRTEPGAAHPHQGGALAFPAWSKILFLLALVLIVGGVMGVQWGAPVSASSHREAPLTSKDPTIDNLDTYAFVSPDDTSKITLIATWIPFEEPAGGPNFYHFEEKDQARYWIKVDRDGDANVDVAYLFEFTTAIQNPNTFLYANGRFTNINDPHYNFRTTYTVTRYNYPGPTTTVLFQDKLMPPDFVGRRTTPNYGGNVGSAAQAVYTNGGTKVFVGQRDDPFFVDVGSIFDLGGLRPFNAAHLIPLATETGRDVLGGFNAHATALQVPKSDLVNPACTNAATDNKCVIGVWSTAERRAQTNRTAGAQSGSGGWVQVSRLGMPLVNEVVMPLALKDAFNGLDPSQDFGLFTSPTPAGKLFNKSVLTPELGILFPVLYPGVNTPPPPRNDIVQVFLTGIPGVTQQQNSASQPSEQLRLNTAIAPTHAVCQGNRMGVLGGDNGGFPNGRRLEDDVTDSALRVVAGVLVNGFNISPNKDLRDGVPHNDRQCLPNFPYMANPWSGYTNTHGTPGDAPPKAANVE